MGWADLLTKLMIPYDSEEALELADSIGSSLRSVADRESSALGKEKGNFPAFDQSPLNKKNGGAWSYMRNAWRLSVAPTGTISMIAEASGGIEPLFSLAYKKHNMSSQLGDTELYYINEEVRKHLPPDVDIEKYVKSGKEIVKCLSDAAQNVFKTSNEINYLNHVRMQAMWQKHVDSGISKTINLPNDASEDNIWDSYMTAWKLGCKGITVYRNGSRTKEVLVSTDGADSQQPLEDIDSSISSMLPVRFNRPDDLEAKVTKIRTGHGNLYVTTAFHEGRLVEIFTHLGKSGAAEHAQSEALGRVISTALQYGVPVSTISRQLRGISSVPVYHNNKLIKSVPDAIASILDGIEPSIDDTEKMNRDWTDQIVAGVSLSECCEECQSTEVSVEEGCVKCYSCGYSKCG
jgi:ribonucleoside-diphosphate reductase alpha chain